MTQENVDVLGRAIVAFNARDVDALRELSDPDLDFRPYAMDPVSGQTYKPAEMERYYRDVDQIWEELTLEPTGLREVGESVVVTAHLRARGRGTGLLLDQTIFMVFDFRHGKLASMRYAQTEDEALRTAGA